MRGFGVVFTLSVAHNGIAIACKRNTWTLGFKRKLTVHPNSVPATIFSDDFHHDEDELDEAAERYHFHPIFLCRISQFFHRAKRMVDLVVVELAHWDGVLCYLCQTLRKIAL